MQTALLTACGLLLIGFVLRAALKGLRALYIPASVIGGLVGLAALLLLAPWRFDVEPALAETLDGARVTESLRTSFNLQGIDVSQDARVSVEVAGGRWRIVDGHKVFLVRAAAERLDVHRLWLGWDTRAVIDILRKWPGWLIAVIFSGLLIERPGKRFGESLKLAAREGVVVWIIILGEIVLGLLATWLVVWRFLEVPGSFGQIIEAGFAGGHGTAAALGEIFEKHLGFADGRDLAFASATIGLVFGVISGIAYVNIAARRGWTRRADVQVPHLSGLEDRHDPRPIAYGRVRGEVIDPLVFQALILSVAFMLGLLFKWLLMQLLGGGLHTAGIAASTVEKMVKYADNLPLFMFTLVAGLVVREAMHWLRIGDLIDPEGMRRLTGAAVEFLIVAAIASLKLTALVRFGWPMALLMALGFAWTGVCLFVIARRLLPRAYWFELGILNYGMSTGTTAQGLMLLRIVDPDLESGAAEDYALAAPLSAPFIGGGVITLMLPLLLQEVHIAWVIAVLLICMTALYAAGWMLAGRERREGAAERASKA